MDQEKCLKLKAELADQPEPQIIPIERFFDGNDDPASLGANLFPHPGINAFRDAFLDLKKRPDVEAIYAQISELDPGADSWPFTDTIFVAGAISPLELREILEPLEIDDVFSAVGYNVPASIAEKHGGRVWAAWWD